MERTVRYSVFDRQLNRGKNGMSQTISYHDLAKMILTAAARIKENCELLSRLDSATGDGDHGATMLRVANTLAQSVQECAQPSIQLLLESTAWNVMSVDGGSTSPLFGSFYMGMAEAATGMEQLDISQLAGLFEAGTAKLMAQTPAKLGDKTLVDALLPATEALKKAAAERHAIAHAMTQAAEAAVRGAENTKAMQAKFGRARNLGARTIGHADPGATSMSIMFAGFRDGLTKS